MLNVYIGKRPKGLDIVDFNDDWFYANGTDINFDSNKVQQIIKDIDGVKYLGDYMIEAKFKPGMAVSVTELSTGCKTALNINRFKDKIFNIAECGDNALNVIFGLKDGNCYMSYFMLPEFLNNRINIIVKGKSVEVSDFSRLMDIVDGVKEWE